MCKTYNFLNSQNSIFLMLGENAFGMIGLTIHVCRAPKQPGFMYSGKITPIKNILGNIGKRDAQTTTHLETFCAFIFHFRQLLIGAPFENTMVVLFFFIFVPQKILHPAGGAFVMINVCLIRRPFKQTILCNGQIVPSRSKQGRGKIFSLKLDRKHTHDWPQMNRTWKIVQYFEKCLKAIILVARIKQYLLKYVHIAL